jgi:serine protease Do
VVALLPDVYTDVASTPWLAANGEPLGYMLAATPDLAAFRSTWTTPGIVVRTAVSLTTKLDAASLLADNGLATVCAGVERSERIHITPVYTYTLLIDTYRECGGASTYTLAAAQSDPTDHLVFLEFQAVNAADRAALDVFLDSFTVERSVGGNGSAAAIVAAPATPTPTPVRPGGVVLANNLNVRSGPGTDFERLGAAPRGTTLPISGQRDNCAWLRVSTPNNLEGWVSGDPELFTLDTPCTAIPAVQP